MGCSQEAFFMISFPISALSPVRGISSPILILLSSAKLELIIRNKLQNDRKRIPPQVYFVSVSLFR